MRLLARNLLLIFKIAFLDYMFVTVDFITRSAQYLMQDKVIHLIRILFTVCMDVLLLPLTLFSFDVWLSLLQNHMRVGFDRTRVERTHRVVYCEMRERLEGVLTVVLSVYHNKGCGASIVNLFIICWRLCLLTISLMRFFSLELRRKSAEWKQSILLRMIMGELTSDAYNPNGNS